MGWTTAYIATVQLRLHAWKSMKLLFIILGLFLMVYGVLGQEPSAPSNTARLSVPTLAEEVKKAELEPRVGLFLMNIRFMRARFSQPTPLAYQYSWDYFKEAKVLVNFSLAEDGFFSKTSAVDRKQKAIELVEPSIRDQNAKVTSATDITVSGELGKQFNLDINGRTVILRTFADKSTWYLLIVELKDGDEMQLAEMLLNSFEFKKADASK
ncbi:MAG TPA: hypothetical protein PKC89_12260 [Pyrinomonadaceae bacterium]|nr:hypothetical protein [Pyrinomonadaceae bacterium]